MSSTLQEDDAKDSVDGECYRAAVTPKRCSNCSPVIKVTWRSRDGVTLARGQRGCHRTPVRVMNSGNSVSSNSSSGTSEHHSDACSHAGSTPHWFIGSPRVQQLKDSEGCANIVLETDLKSMRLGRTEFSQSHDSVSVSVNQTTNNTPKKTCTGSWTLNPFELDLVDTMHLSAFSPSVFSKVVTPIKDEQQDDGYNFSWGIDNVAVLYPREFDDVPSEASSLPKFDQEVEDRLQHAINTFFHTACVPSPWADCKIRLVNSPGEHFNSATERKVSSLGPPLKSKRDVSCQTMLTLPTNFDLQLVLENYYTYNKSEVQNETCWSEDDADAKEVLSTSSLRRKLFANDEEQLVTPPEGRTALETIPAERTVSPMAHESIPIDSLPQTPFQDQCASSPLGKFSGRHQRASLTPPTITSPTVSPIRVLVREMEEADQGESDADVSFMSTCHMQSMAECQERLNLSQSSNSLSYIQQNTEDYQYVGHNIRAVGLPVLEPVDEDMEQFAETTTDVYTASNFKTSFMETTTDNSCCGIPGSQFVTTGNHDTGYQTNALQITTSSSSDAAISFSTSIQAPLQLWHKKATRKCGVNSFNPQNMTDMGKSTIQLTNEMESEDASQTTRNGDNSENVWSPLVASTPSRSKLAIF